MSELQDKNSSLSRREALKALAAASGAVMLAGMPQNWETPVVQVGNLPVHAQGSVEGNFVNPQSPADFSFENEEPEIDLGGSSLDAQTTGDGWLVLNSDLSTNVISGMGSSKPWRKIKRKWGILAPIWPVSYTIKLVFKFKPRSGYGSSHRIKDDIPFWFYGVSAITGEYYASQAVFKGGKVTVNFQVPAISGSYFPFYCSGYFPNPISLAGGYTVNPGYYLNWGIYGGKYSYS